MDKKNKGKDTGKEGLTNIMDTMMEEGQSADLLIDRWLKKGEEWIDGRMNGSNILK